MLVDHDTEVENHQRTRSITAASGRDYLIECRDPFGFWYVMKPKNVPELDSMFTSIEQAETAIVNYDSKLPALPRSVDRGIVSTDGNGKRTRIHLSKE